MFKHLGLLSKFDITVENLVRFLLTVKLNYNNNPFHNWMHAWSVMHASWLMISCPEVASRSRSPNSSPSPNLSPSSLPQPLSLHLSSIMA